VHFSPQSFLQSSLNGVPLASGKAADEKSINLVGKPIITNKGIVVKLKAKTPGTANLFVWSNKQIVDKKTVNFEQNKRNKVFLQYPADKQSENSYLLISYETLDGKTKRSHHHIL
jgi:hypothetical protein